MKTILAVAVVSLGLMSCGALKEISECATFTAFEDMYENSKDQALDEDRLLGEIRKLAIKIEEQINLPHEPELVHARKYCEELLRD